VGQDGRRPGVWKRWALIALAIAVGSALWQLAWDQVLGRDIKYPVLYLLFSIVVGFALYLGTFALAELWSRRRGRNSLHVESHLPAMPSLSWVQSALVEADRDCVVDSCHGDDRRVIAHGRWNRLTSRQFQLTIEPTEGGYRTVIWSEVPPRFLDRGKTDALVARAHTGLRWRCAETVGV
jgi:hypothetical protein